ncbi:CheR family methyltransferase, partial [Cryobacterium sp. MLB-32]|uniref:CheR family methyltransferase n=1 Tax=Cryobacterium sp. MLB-32 TaxID=1529318 RepID=UPI0026F399D4
MRRTSEARYSTREIAGLSTERMSRHLIQVGDEWEISQRLRNRVVGLHHNLLDPLPPQVSGSQVVLCCNVLIYLSVDHAKGFLRSVARALPEVWLLLGASETMLVIGDGFTTVRMGDSYVSRPSSGVGEPRVVTPPPSRAASHGARRAGAPP